MFKKSIILSTLLLPVFVYGDAFDLNGGLGSWSSSSGGTITEVLDSMVTVTDVLSDDQKENYYFVELQHSLPIVPNIRVEYTSIHSSGKKAEVSAVTPMPFSIPQVSFAKESTLSMKQYDAILFYRLLKNILLVSLDAGLDVKYLETEYQVESYIDNRSTSVIPLLYVRGGVEMPFGLGAEADVRYITDGTSTVYDISAKLKYKMTFVPVIQPGLEVGYRQQKFLTDSGETTLIAPILSGETKTDITFSGLYAGLTVHF